MKCGRCQHENPADAAFCDECGTRLEATCPSCGEANRAGAKFCRKCGQGLTQPAAASPALPPQFASPESCTPKHLAEKILTSKAALEGERKQVTVLFADLKGSKVATKRAARLCATVTMAASAKLRRPWRWPRKVSMTSGNMSEDGTNSTSRA